MNLTYTWALARKILFVFLIFTIIFSLASLFLRHAISSKLENTADFAKTVDQSQTRPERILLLIHSAEDDFQASLLNTNNYNAVSYKTKLSRALDMIDTLLNEKTDTSRLSITQLNQVKFWYRKKLALSDRLYTLRHGLDSLLTAYADYNRKKDASLRDFNTNTHIHKKNIKNNTDTVRKVLITEKKGLLRRLKDAISNKNNVTAIEINHNKDTQVTDSYTQKVGNDEKSAYIHRLQKLQQQHTGLLDMQKQLIILNAHISNELEHLVSEAKDANNHLADDFKDTTIKNYKTMTVLLNRFYTAAFVLVLLFAGLLIIFILQLNNAELLLRKENELSVNLAQQKIDDLIRKIELSEGKQSASQLDELKEIVQLIVNNNPAFLVKFNEFDTEFCKKLLEIAPTLIAAEIELCVLLRLNFETKEIARYTKTSVRAVEGKKYRIRKKLGVPSDQDINIWMTNI